MRLLELDAARLLYPDADEELVERIVGTLANGTYRIYSAEMTAYVRYCAAQGEPAVPASAATMARWALSLADSGLSYRRIHRRIYAVRAVTTMLGLPAPTDDRLVTRAFARIARQYGRHADNQRLPFRPDELRRSLPYLDILAQKFPERAALVRAVLALGIATALRRSELVALDTDDIEVVSRGLRVRVRKTKTRSEADPPAYIDVARITDTRICPVQAVLDYAQICRLTPGPLFRGTLPDGSLRNARLGADSVRHIVREVIERAGIGDPNAYGAHSLRIGMMTAAYENRAHLDDMMRVSLHIDEKTAHKYVRPKPFARSMTGVIFE